MKYFVCVLSNKARTRRKVVITENPHELMRAENGVTRAVYKKCSGLDELIYTEECADLSTAENRRDELRAKAK